MKYLMTFTVLGRGDFPFDMLRYDACFPMDTEDARGLRTPENEGGHRMITLQRYVPDKHRIPALARWKSFGWVVDVSTIDVRKV